MIFKGKIKKVIAGMMATYMIAGNMLGVGIGLGQVIAEEIKAPGIVIENQEQAYIPYSNTYSKGTVLQEQIKLGQDSQNGKHMQVDNVTVEVSVPKLNDKTPERVSIIKANTKSTNGKEEQISQNYNKETGLLTIAYNNPEGYNQENETQKDEFEILYIYSETVETKTNTSRKIKAKVEYKTANGNVSSEKEKVINGSVETKNAELTSYQTIKSSAIYKGFMYSNIENNTAYETAYNTTEQLTIRDKDQIETTTINLNAGKYLAKEKETDTDTIIYKASNISEQEFNKIYGKNGSIEVYIGETKYASVGYSQAEKEEDRKYETVYYVENAPENKQAGRIEYPEGTTNITIKTSNPQAEGKLKIEQEKAIKSAQDYGVKVENIEAIVESNKITSTKTYKTQEIKKDEKGEVVKDEAGNEVKEEKSETITATSTEAKGNIKLSEPTKQIKTDISNKNLSTLANNKTKVTIKLDDTNSSCKLFGAGQITIKLPNNLSSAKITSAEALYENGIKITSAKIEKGYVVLQVAGKQTSYDIENVSGGVNIVIELELDIEDTVPSHEETMDITYGEVTAKENLNIVSKSGILVLNKMENYNDKNETVTALDNSIKTLKLDVNKEARKTKQTINILNNYNEDVTGMSIIGRIGAQVNDTASNFELTFAEAIKTNSKVAKVYYSDNVNAVATDNTWSETCTTKSRAYKIELTEEALKAKELLTIEYALSIPANLEYNKKGYVDTNVTYTYSNMPLTQRTVLLLATEEKDDSILGLNSELQNQVVGTQNENLKLSTLVTAGEKVINENDPVYEGQILRYTTTVENIGNEIINNLQIKTQIENGVYYEVRSTGKEYTVTPEGESKIATEYMTAPVNDLTRESKVFSLNKNEKVTYEYQVLVTENVNDVKSKIQVINTSNNNAVSIEKQLTSAVKQAKLSTILKYAYNEEKEVYSKDKMNMFLKIKSYEEDLKNIKTEIALPEELTMDTYETYGVDNEIKVEQNDDGTVKLTINKLNRNSELNILLICNTKSIDKETVNKDIKVSAITKVGREEYNSNTLIKTINQSETGLSMEINKNFTADETFKENKNLEYSVYLKNNGSLDLNTLKVITQLDKGLTIKELYINGVKTEVSDGSNLETYLKLASKKEITVKYILGLDINEADKEKELEINTSIDSGYTEQLTNKTIVKINKNAEETPDNPDNPENPDTPDNPDNPNPTPENKKFKIEGTAWLDSDKDGKRDEGETLLKDIKVTLINKETGETVKDESGNARTATTDENGKYSFDNLSKGTYLVVFEFDSNKYTVTTYQKEGIENSLNSDATMSNIKIDGNSKLVGVTDYIKLEDADASNIDLGLIENAVFDLSLNKLIDSITVVTVQGNKTTNYKNKNFAKVDLVARYMNDTDVIIKYKFVIKNEGDVTAYVDRLEDNLPSGLEFSSELNKDWYKGSDGNLYTTSLAGIAIEPGKTSETELVLTKKTTEETTGTFKNNAELSKISNLEAIEEKEEAKANNKSSADVVISIKTGSAIMYIGITLGSMAIIAAGAYIIKKKVINKGI